MPTPEQNERTIGRIPSQATASIRQVLENAKRAANLAVAEACEAELKLRGAFIMTADDAQ